MIVTRIPPSPTGHLHIGTARTALFNFLYAKQNGGKVVFRSEDTDRARSKIEYEEEIIRDLNWLGITWNNQEILRQSERANTYRKYLEKLISGGEAYLSTEESKAEPGKQVTVVRLKNPGRDITFHDAVRGDITFNTAELGDIVIARDLDDALYHFTVVIDDYEMGVTHVIRGDDHISNTPRQILIQEALGFPRPIYAHIPLILAPDRSKMSKRHGTVAVADYRAGGYTREALINYIALLGWNPGTDQEMFTLSELIEKFKLEQVQKGGAVFDIAKLNWFNREYLKRYSDNDFINYLAADTNFPTQLNNQQNRLVRLAPSLKERFTTRQAIIAELVAGNYDFCFSAPEYPSDWLLPKADYDKKQISAHLMAVSQLLSANDFSDIEKIKTAVWAYAEAAGKGNVLGPMRIALSGKKQSPDPFTIAWIIGKEETVARLKTACAKIGE